MNYELFQGGLSFPKTFDEVCVCVCLCRPHMQSVFVVTARIMAVRVFLFVHDNQGVCELLRRADAAH